MDELGGQPRSATVEPRGADAVGMSARAEFEPFFVGRVSIDSVCRHLIEGLKSSNTAVEQTYLMPSFNSYIRRSSSQ
jgi:hypothetical protein